VEHVSAGLTPQEPIMTARHTLSVAVVLLLPLPASAAETLWTEVTVRVYDATGAGAAARRASLDIASSIVSAASVELIWRHCNGPAVKGQPALAGQGNPTHCELPLAPRELALRFVRSGAVNEQSRELPLGDALINARTGGGVLATIYLDRVEWMAQQTGIDPRALLGRAIAHELGHLLMATSAHAANGLMRPIWLQSEIRRRHNTDWTFRPTEIAAIRTRLSFVPGP
jgi:hypothetical protein